jgi:hypothetical protein
MARTKKEFNMFDLTIGLIVIISILGAMNIIPTGFANFLTELLISAIPGIIISILSARIVENITGDTLKKISLTHKVFGFEVSITAFVIVTFLFRIFWFGI